MGWKKENSLLLNPPFNKKDWLKRLSPCVGDMMDVQDKFVADWKKVMISSAIQSLIDEYKENNNWQRIY